LQGRVVNAFEAVAEGTRITLTTEGEMTGFYKMMEPLIAELLERQAEEALANLKAVLEAA
jgi:enamine deaminase RidA (YjgF/YER057c/UK114 family)